LSKQEIKILGLFIFFGIFGFFSIGCEKLEGLKIPYKRNITVQGTLIAKVGDLPITLEQLEQEIQNYNALTDNPAAKITTREQKIAYLNEELIRRYLLYFEAKTKGLDQQPKIQEQLRIVEINILASQLAQDEISSLTVTSSEVEDFYNLYKDQFQQEEERRIREIVVDDEAAAKDALIELLKGTDFATLARERSRVASAANGGDSGFIKKGARGPNFTRFDIVVFSPSLEVGQASNIFKDKDGYYIIKLEGKRGGQPKPLSEVWDEIKTNVLFLKQQQKLQEITGGLLKKTKVAIFEDKIK
jgi:parvulin-like peptidyl-prolyl isomerase